MRAVLDGTFEFDEQQLTVGSRRREVVERAVCGLDGVLSIDLGARTRQIIQKGVLRAQSSEALEEKITAVSAFFDGNTHTLITQDGQQFDNMRVDGFKMEQEDYSGRGVGVRFEISYTQLREV